MARVQGPRQHGMFKENRFFRFPNLTKGQHLDVLWTYEIVKIKSNGINQMPVTLGIAQALKPSAQASLPYHPRQTQSTYHINLNRKASHRSINPVLYCRG